MAAAEELGSELADERLTGPGVRMAAAGGLRGDGEVYTDVSEGRISPGPPVAGGVTGKTRMGARWMREGVGSRAPDEEEWRRPVTKAATYVEGLTREKR
ncbi:hypothetical protein [Nonomuraea sp. NPDC050643]|uniref:hypothetical protein n=1 Tax=Nonomuraea sp. NPDC050643 TaxID=3155660 RepID=UPI0033FD265A